MKNKQVFEKIGERFIGSKGEFQAFEEIEKKSLGTLEAIRFKGENLIIFDFSSEKKVSLFASLILFCIVKKEYAEGCSGDEVCANFYLGGRDFIDILGSILAPPE